MSTKKLIIWIVVSIFIITIILSNIVLLRKYIQLNKKEAIVNEEDSDIVENVTNDKNNSSNEKLDKIRLAKLQKMGERGRMETYFHDFVTYIEDKEYEKAYDLLYHGFKEIYFPTIESFIEYAKKTYTEESAYNYISIQRQGTIYVLKIEIVNIELPKDQNTKTQRVVIQEYDFNDFVLSFQIV